MGEARITAGRRTVASVLVPHVRGHLVAMQRFPDGIDAEPAARRLAKLGA